MDSHSDRSLVTSTAFRDGQARLKQRCTGHVLRQALHGCAVKCVHCVLQPVDQWRVAIREDLLERAHNDPELLFLLVLILVRKPVLRLGILDQLLEVGKLLALLTRRRDQRRLRHLRVLGMATHLAGFHCG